MVATPPSTSRACFTFLSASSSAAAATADIAAARALKKIPADRPKIANLRRRDRIGRLDQSRKSLPHRGILFELRERDHRAQTQAALVVRRDLIQPLNRLEVHYPRRAHD